MILKVGDFDSIPNPSGNSMKLSDSDIGHSHHVELVLAPIG